MRLATLTVSCLLLAAAQVAACSVPVFRYGLERWPADPHQVTVLHRGALPAHQQALFADVGKRQGVNIEVAAFDVDAPGQQEARASASAAGIDLSTPRLVLSHATGPAGGAPYSVQELSAETIGRSLDSPIRRALVQRIVAGDSAVWVLVVGGDAAADAALRTLVQAKVAELSKLIELPAHDGQSDSNLSSPLPLRIGFGVVEVRRDDPAEQVFLDMLLTGTPLRTATAPALAAVFARGRMLGPFGSGVQEIDGPLIDEVAMFLCGACSCQVKALNPGSDLLLTADWDALVYPEAPAAPVPQLPRPTVETTTPQQ